MFDRSSQTNYVAIRNCSKVSLDLEFLIEAILILTWRQPQKDFFTRDGIVWQRPTNSFKGCGLFTGQLGILWKPENIPITWSNRDVSRSWNESIDIRIERNSIGKMRNMSDSIHWGEAHISEKENSRTSLSLAFVQYEFLRYHAL